MLSVVRPSEPIPQEIPNVYKMSWEELSRLSDREILLLLHQRLETLEEQQRVRKNDVWKATGVIISLLAVAVAAHAAHIF